MIQVYVDITKGVHKVAGLQVTDLSHHHRQQGVGSDVTSVHEVNIVYADECIAFEKKGENILIRYLDWVFSDPTSEEALNAVKDEGILIKRTEFERLLNTWLTIIKEKPVVIELSEDNGTYILNHFDGSKFKELFDALYF